MFEPKEDSNDQQKKLRHKFYLVFADLNNSKGPNTVAYESGKQTGKTKDPDIFVFAALETGYVAPVGIAEVEPRYLTTRIQYFHKESGDKTSYKYSQQSKSLLASRAEAWGYYGVPKDKPDDTDKPEVPATDKDDKLYIDGEMGLSYGDYIKSVLDDQVTGAGDTSIKSLMYKFLDGGSFREYFENDELTKDLKLQNKEPEFASNNKYKNTGGYGCKPHLANEGLCEVHVDKYIY